MLKDRSTALLIDYLIIWIYLITLAAVITIFYYLVFDGILEFSHLTSQLVAFVTTVLLITVVFAVMEAKTPYGTIGKRKRNIKISYKNKIFSCFLRSCSRKIQMKNTLPAQLAACFTYSGNIL